MPVHINVGGAWKQCDDVHINVGGTWKTCDDSPINVAGSWKTGLLGSSVSVSALGNGDTNTREDNTCYVGVKFDNNGSEYECTNAGTFSSNLGVWLDVGLNSEVWVERVVTAGSWNYTDPGTGRHVLSTDRTFLLRRTSPGTTTCTGYFKFWDAASGGTLVQQTASASYSATYTSDV